MTVEQAAATAIADLRACYGPRGIYAGLQHFKDYWARDAFFSCLGAVEIGDRAIVRRTLRTFASAQAPDGAIALRIGAPHMLPKLIGIHQPRIPVFGEDKRRGHTYDSTALFIIAAAALGERATLRKLLPQLRAAATHLMRALRGGLISEDYFCGWMDSVRKRGHVFYTHVLAYKALCDFSGIASQLGADDAHAGAQAARLRRACRAFWNGTHFIDAIDENRRMENEPLAENALAILWGLATPAQSARIAKSFPERLSEPAHPPYTREFEHLPLRIAGMGDYHSRLIWIWTNAAIAHALATAGESARAQALVEKMAELIIRHGTVHEVYTAAGEPVRRLLYRSERPFAWSAAMFILAARALTRARSAGGSSPSRAPR